LSNNIKRYTGKTEGTVLGSPHWENPEGEWVKWEDYATLMTEVEVLKGKVLYWRIEAECDHGRWLRVLKNLEELRASSLVTIDTENARLQDEVERLQNLCDFLEGRNSQ